MIATEPMVSIGQVEIITSKVLHDLVNGMSVCNIKKNAHCELLL